MRTINSNYLNDVILQIEKITKKERTTQNKKLDIKERNYENVTKIKKDIYNNSKDSETLKNRNF